MQAVTGGRRLCAARSSRCSSSSSPSLFRERVCDCHPYNWDNRSTLALSHRTQIVQSTESIGAAIERAEPGSEIIVEPGEYRERLILRDNVRLVSRVPRGATIRLPATASDAQTEPAVVAAGATNAEFVGFKIVGDAKTPLGVGILVADSAISLVDVEVTGAATAGIYFARAQTAQSRRKRNP